MSSWHNDYLEMKYEEQKEEYEQLMEEKRKENPNATYDELEDLVNQHYQDEEYNSYDGHPSLTVSERNR